MSGADRASEILRTTIAAIGPASQAHAEGARLLLAKAGADVLVRAGAAMAAAQHDARVAADRRALVIVASDHRCAELGVSLGADHTTALQLEAIADGRAAVTRLARTSQTPVMLIEAGVAEPAHVPAAAIGLALPQARDVRREGALERPELIAGLEAGIALAISLAEPGGGLDVIALGAAGLGAELASAGLIGALTGVVPPTDARDADAAAVAAAGAAASPLAEPLDTARFAGSDHAVLAGLILGAASLDAAVLLDGQTTAAAALLACALAPAARGYLIAAHRGDPAAAVAFAHLGLEPLFGSGFGHGDGSGAAMALPLLLQVAALARAGYNQDR